MLEVQGCGPDCDYVCSECEWEMCVVMADHGRSCDVCLKAEPDVRIDRILNRFLRVPAAGVAKRRRNR